MKHNFIIDTTKFLFVLLFFNSCFKDDFKNISIEGWNPDLAVPIATAYYSIQDLIDVAPENGFVNVDETDLINIVYQNEIYNLKAKDIINFPNYSQLLDTATNSIHLDINNESILKKVVLKNGEIHYTVSSSYAEPVVVNLIIPNATLDGVAFHTSFVIPANSTVNGVIDISNYSIDLNDGLLSVEYYSELISSGLAVSLDLFDFRLEELEWKNLNGFLGDLEIDYEFEPIDLKLFENWILGSVHLVSPKINIEFFNSFGLPFSTNLTNFNFSNDNSNALNLSGSFSNSNIIVHPLSVGNDSETTQFEINNSNSNISDVLVLTPTQLNYDFDLYSHLQVDTSFLNFVNQDSELSLSVDVSIPLHGRIEGVVFVDSFLVDFDDNLPVEEVLFKLKTTNFLPLSLGIQVYMIDAQQNIIDSLLVEDTNILSSGPLDDKGRLIASKEKIDYIKLKNEQIDNFNNTESLYVKIFLETANDGLSNVQFLSTNGLGLELGVQTKVAL